METAAEAATQTAAASGPVHPLTLSQSTVTNNSATAGNGGDGGDASTGTGGTGGDGGDADGGGVHHDDTFTNTGNTISGNTVAFGIGGAGGDPDDNDGNDGTATNPNFNP